MSVSALALAVVLLTQQPATGAQASTQEAAHLEDVVVEGRRLREAVREFVGEIGAPSGMRGPARWNEGVCIGVMNLRNDAAQVIIDRASDVARELGLAAGEPGCRPNVLIIAASDGSAVADALVEARGLAFRPGGSGMTRTLNDLRDFRTSDAAVRWWHVSAPVDSETGELATRLPGYEAPRISVSRASRLRTDIRDDLMRAIIVVDVAKTDQISIMQLADYLALISLAQIDPEADVSGFETVLNVFREPRTAGLTDWDMNYLRALYNVEQNSVGADARGAEIMEQMLRNARVAEALSAED